MLRLMRTLQKTRPTFSDGILHLQIPQSWDEMTQPQLRYAFFCLSTFSPDAAKVHMLCRFAGFRVHRRDEKGWLCSTTDDKSHRVTFVIHSWQISSYIHQLEYLDTADNMHVRLVTLYGSGRAVDTMLHGVPFVDYLTMENYYQAYIQTQDTKMIAQLANILYQYDFNGNLDARSILAVITWYAAIKYEFARQFSYLFRPSHADDQVKMVDVMNSEIRGLTDGDITKEDAVLHQDVWRALTELDNKAREVEQLKK